MTEPLWWCEAKRLFESSSRSHNPRPRKNSLRGIAKTLHKSVSSIGYVVYPKIRETKKAYQKSYRAARRRDFELEGQYVEKWSQRKKAKAP